MTSVSVLLLIGCYPSEEYSSLRIHWLEESLKDLANQVLPPTEILVSLNNTVYLDNRVIQLISKYIPMAQTFLYHLPRSGSLNFETILQFASSEFVCFWSDHDRHSPLFLKEACFYASSTTASHVCPVINYIYENGEPYHPEPTSLSAQETTCLDSLDSFAQALASDVRGSIYGLWKRALFDNFSIFCHESIDFLLVYYAALNGGYVYFESCSEALTLRHKIGKTVNHDSLLPKSIMSVFHYQASRHARFLRVLIDIIELSALDGPLRTKARKIVRSTFSSKSNCYGQAYYGLKILALNFVRFIFFKDKEASFFLQLLLSMSAWRLLHAKGSFGN
jgi:hypothetical protein